MDQAERFVGTTVDGRYRLTEFIGSGSYGSVFAADEVTLGHVISRVAVKIITPDNAEQRSSVLNEIVGLARLHHDYIIGYRSSGLIAYGDFAGSIFLATELGDTTLSDLAKSSDQMSDELLRDMIRGLASALAHIHSQGHVHGDVKPANIIRVKGRWKLADLGLLRSTRKRSAGPLQGSLVYLAPEMLRHEFGPANDIYALGVTLLYYLAGKHAHAGESREEFVENLRTQPPSIPDRMREPWKSLIARCLMRNPAHRLTALQIETLMRPESGPLDELSARLESSAPVIDLPVSIVGGTQFHTIQEAITHAPPCSRIVIQPGKYRETLVLDKPLELVGDGSADDVIISVRDSRCLEMATPGEVLVRNLTLRCRPGTKNEECYAVDIGQGRLIMEDCIVRSHRLACVAIHGGADPLLRRCEIVGSTDVGVFVYEHGRGTLEECNITGHGRSGVTIGEAADVTFRGCHIAANRGGGVFIFEEGHGMFEECRIVGNAKAGAVLGSGGRGDFSHCEIRENEGEGIVLQPRATAAVMNCKLTNNAAGPWRVSQPCSLQHRDNEE